MTAMVVHAVHSILRGYCSLSNSMSFLTALGTSTCESLAIVCTFRSVAIITDRFCWKGEWLLK